MSPLPLPRIRKSHFIPRLERRGLSCALSCNPYLPNKLYKAVRQWYHQQQQAKPIQPAPKLYRDPQQRYQEYQEGYQAYQGQTYEPPSPVQGYEQQEYPQYEQPQAAYPEMPPQQQRQSLESPDLHIAEHYLNWRICRIVGMTAVVGKDANGTVSIGAITEASHE